MNAQVGLDNRRINTYIEHTEFERISQTQHTEYNLDTNLYQTKHGCNQRMTFSLPILKDSSLKLICAGLYEQ